MKFHRFVQTGIRGFYDENVAKLDRKLGIATFVSNIFLLRSFISSVRSTIADSRSSDIIGRQAR